MLNWKRKDQIKTEPVERVIASGVNGRTFMAKMKRVAKLISQSRLHESSIKVGFVTHLPSLAFFMINYQAKEAL
jgi:hypothetical protein